MELADVDSIEIHGASDQVVQITAELRAHSSLDVVLVLKRVAPITRPVDLARKLKAFGLGCRTRIEHWIALSQTKR